MVEEMITTKSVWVLFSMKYIIRLSVTQTGLVVIIFSTSVAIIKYRQNINKPGRYYNKTILSFFFAFFIIQMTFRSNDHFGQMTIRSIFGFSVFGLWGLIFAFLTSLSSLDQYKISDRLIGHMTYFIFEPPNAQPRASGSQFF
jgi:hypothetical protein